MNQSVLNLSRKWRSRQFDAVIGQELSIRILQNSLYRNQFFPVYLFSGQRGCGKTTSARLFAAALNCEGLELFQKQPKIAKIPCLLCSSCKAMATGAHPDFIEIDAASHTGVDNVRNIIESASLLPVFGRKKVYLIDEAHMLSKAAFNAFLKILEEPPASVLFILATTDPHKIIETVRSRCFQLFFTSIASEVVADHLEMICREEQIPCDKPALVIIAHETEGSARDAINLLEQVRFSTDRVTVEAVLAVLGHIPEQLLISLFEKSINADVQGLVELLRSCGFERYAPLALWQKSTELVRHLLFYKQGVIQRTSFEDRERLKELSEKVTVIELITFLKKLYTCESLLLKSTVQHNILELFFIEVSQRSAMVLSSAEQKASVLAVTSSRTMPSQSVQVVSSGIEALKDLPGILPQDEIEDVIDERWNAFIDQVATLSDPLLKSIFKQAHFKEYQKETGMITVIFTKEATFFKQWIHDSKPVWLPFLEKIFGIPVDLILLFDHNKTAQSIVPRAAVERSSGAVLKASDDREVSKDGSKKTFDAPRAGYQQSKTIHATALQSSGLKKETVIDVSDTQKWQKANLLKDLFGGSVVNAEEDEIHVETGQ